MSTRKLQQEFDKTNKKIAEGLQIFDDIYEKLMTTEISSQKEKLESDLKKEIKKLQRSRDQLKQWLGDGSIKLDKNMLQDNRTKIEHAMDQFKDLEKSSKIKQFSNEGLELQSQQRRFNKFGDAEDAKRQEAYNYLSDIIDQIQQQNDTFEQEVNSLASSLKKAKSSNIYSIQSQIDDVKYKMERNNSHIERIERILNNLDNEKLDPNKVDDIKDDLEYYVENNQEEDYVEYDDFYDQLEIEDDEIEVHGSLSQMAVDDSEYEPKLPEQAKDAPITPSKSDNVTKTVSNTSTGSGSAVLSHATIGTTSVPPGITSNAPSALTTPTKKTVKPSVGPAIAPIAAVTAAAPPPPPPPINYSNVIKAVQATNAAAASHGSSGIAPPPGLNPIIQSNHNNEAEKNGAAEYGNGEEEHFEGRYDEVEQSFGEGNESYIGEDRRGEEEEEEEGEDDDEDDDEYTEIKEGTQSPDYISGEDHSLFKLKNIFQSRIRKPLPYATVSHMIEVSLNNCPDSQDSDKPRQYNPQTIHPSSVDYPQEPMFELTSSNIFKKFDNDTLFFCFYYSDRKDQISRYNAAKELSKRGWIFNNELKQWFQKEKKTVNNKSSIVQKEGESEQENDATNGAAAVEDGNNDDDFKESNYKYFDYEKTWLTRRRENYTFAKELRETF